MKAEANCELFTLAVEFVLSAAEELPLAVPFSVASTSGFLATKSTWNVDVSCVPTLAILPIPSTTTSLVLELDVAPDAVVSVASNAFP